MINTLHSKISAIEYYLPKACETNNDLELENPDWRMDDIVLKTGIHKRWISSADETAVDLAFNACKKIIQRCGDDFDTLILVTQSPDYFLPTSACVLQDMLGLSTKVKCFDINLGCSGFVYGLSIASSLIESGVSNNVLLVCSDTYSKYIKNNDRTNRPIFSDGASATLIKKSNSKNTGPFSLETDGSGFSDLIVENGASRSKLSFESGCSLFMNGSKVFMFTLSNVPRNVKEILDLSDIKIDEVDHFFFHQASKIVLDNLKRSLSIPSKKFYMGMENIGNTVSSTIPIALKDAAKSGVIKKGDILLLSGFGVGLSLGSCIIKWDQC